MIRFRPLQNAPRPNLPKIVNSTSVNYLEAGENESGQRLDNFLLTRLRGVPKSRIYRIIRKGEVRVNGGRCNPATRLKTGDRIRIPPIRAAAQNQARANPAQIERLEQCILYQDRDLLVLDKPCGLAVHGGSGIDIGVIETLKQSALYDGFLELAHRLDRETSGCLVMARNREALLRLHELFRRDRPGVNKYYLALCLGRLDPASRQVTLPIKRLAGEAGRAKCVIADDGQASLSEIVTRQVFANSSLVRIRLATGRTHQARVHCAGIGHPILGDGMYGDFAANREFKQLGLNRLFLHASEIQFKHPLSGKALRLRASLPPELTRVLDSLGNSAEGV